MGKQKSSEKSRIVRRKTKNNHCQEKRGNALIFLDSSKIRKKYTALYKRARTTYSKAKKELDVFEKQDEPAFEQWLFSNLGPEISLLRELQRQLSGKQRLWKRILIESQLSGRSMHESYRRIQNGEEEIINKCEQHQGAAQEKDKNNFFSDEDEVDWEEAFNEFADFLRDSFNGSEFEEENGEKINLRNEDYRLRLKSVYRDICRRLHPDAEGADTSEELEIWHHVQEAYQQNDLETLEILRAKTDIAQNTINSNTPISYIQRMTEEYKKARSSIRNSIRRARHNVAWGFSQWSHGKSEMILETNRRYFEEEVGELKKELDNIELFLKELEEQAEQEQEEYDHSFNWQAANGSSRSHRGRQGSRKSGKRRESESDAQLEFDFVQSI